MEDSQAMKALPVLLAALISGTAAMAQPVSYLCKFPQYASPTGLAKDPNFEIRFVHDKAADKAYMLGNNGASPVEVIPNAYGLSFIEMSAIGNIFTTTVTKDGRAVHSRHTILNNEMVPTQYYGTCKIQQ
jgi:hypothetical protein